MALQAKLDAVKRDPNNAQLWVELAHYLKKNDMIQQAQSSYERALQLDPTREELYEELWKLETHDALPLWFNELDQAGNTHESPVKEGDKRQAKEQHNRSATFITLGLLACVSIFVLAGLGFMLLSPQSNKIIEVQSPNGTTVMIPEATLNARGQIEDDAIIFGHPLLLKDGMRVTLKKAFIDTSEEFDIRYYYRKKGDTEHEWYAGPPPDMRPFVLRVIVENVSSERGYISLNSYGAVQDKDSIIYDQDCGVVPGDVQSSIQRNEQTEGNICFLIPKEAEIEYFLYDSYDERRYFRLN